MSKAEDLLNSLTDEQISTYTADMLTEEHIVIGPDRFIKIPEPLKRIAVQYDHRVETVTFDCPRYWDEHDLSTMIIYINYLRQDGVKGAYIAKNIVVDEVDENIIHFDWTIHQEISLVEGKINFLVCAITTDETGNQELHWNSEINSEMYISKGLEAEEVILQEYPSIITDLLTRMNQILIGDGTVIDTSLTQPGVAADAATVGELIRELDATTVKEEVDPTVSDWAKQPEKPTYSHDELTDGDLIALKNGEVQINLNAEMVGGSTVKEINSHSTKIDRYHYANIEYVTTADNTSIGLITLNVDSTSYDVNQRVLIDLVNEEHAFTENIIPKFSSGQTNINGWVVSHPEVFDRDDSTYAYQGSNAKTISVKFPVAIKPSKMRINSHLVSISSVGRLTIVGTSITSETVSYYNKSISDTGDYNYTVTSTDPNYVSELRINYDISHSSSYHRTFELLEGVYVVNTNTTQIYINIDGLGNKLITGDTLVNGKKYELIYDGTSFVAHVLEHVE